jgi:predicted nucleic acid-binding protein
LDDIYLSVLTLGELRKGVDKLRAGAKKKSLEGWLERVAAAARKRLLPIDHETAVVWGELSARAEKKGRPIPVVDCLLAATALRHGLRLMTRNVADFEPTGVLIVNPWVD